MRMYRIAKPDHVPRKYPRNWLRKTTREECRLRPLYLLLHWPIDERPQRTSMRAVKSVVADRQAVLEGLHHSPISIARYQPCRPNRYQMGLFQPDSGPIVIERRAARRSRVTCAASLQTISAENLGQLWDLSQTGARIKADDPPEPETTAILRWASEQVMCRIVWTDDDMCGVAFDRAIEGSVVAAAARMTGVIEKPIASISNIAVGQKRSAKDSSKADSLEPVGGPLGWYVLPSRPENRDRIDLHTQMTSAEEMFFFGSPIAHVLAYEARFSP